MMTITGFEKEIPEHLLEGQEVIKKHTGYGVSYSTHNKETLKDESLEICFRAAEKSMECVGLNYITRDPYSDFRAYVALDYYDIFKRKISPIKIHSHLNIIGEKAETKSKFICQKKPVFTIDAEVTEELKDEYMFLSHELSTSMQMGQKLALINQWTPKEEYELYSALFEIQVINSLIPKIKDREQLFEAVGNLTRAIERANYEYLMLKKDSIKLDLTVI